MLNLSYEDKNLINKKDFEYSFVKKINFSIGSCYVKKCFNDEDFRELIGKKVFDIVGIKCPKYCYFDSEFVISEDLNQFDNFRYISNVPNIGDVIVNHFTTIDYIYDALCELVVNRDEIYFQLSVIHFIDILFSNIDRHVGNYGISIDEFGNGTLVVFDNGMFLENFNSVICPPSLMNCINREQEIDNFISSLSLEHSEYIIKIFEYFKPENVWKIFLQVEKEINREFKNKKSLLKRYIKNYLMIFRVLNKYVDRDNLDNIKLNKSL